MNANRIEQAVQFIKLALLSGALVFTGLVYKSLSGQREWTQLQGRQIRALRQEAQILTVGLQAARLKIDELCRDHGCE